MDDYHLLPDQPAHLDQQCKSESGEWIQQRAAIHYLRQQLRFRLQRNAADGAARPMPTVRSVPSAARRSPLTRTSLPRAATGTVEVINPDGQSSGQFTFTVNAPASAPPSISSVSPQSGDGIQQRAAIHYLRQQLRFRLQRNAADGMRDLCQPHDQLLQQHGDHH